MVDPGTHLHDQEIKSLRLVSSLDNGYRVCEQQWEATPCNSEKSPDPTPQEKELNQKENFS